MTDATSAIYATRQPTTPEDRADAARAALRHGAWSVEEWIRPGEPSALAVRAPDRRQADWVIARSGGRLVAIELASGELLGSFDQAGAAVGAVVWLHTGDLPIQAGEVVQA